MQVYGAIPWDAGAQYGGVGLHRFTVHYLRVHVYSTLLGSAGVKYITWGAGVQYLVILGVQMFRTLPRDAGVHWLGCRCAVHYLGVQVYSTLPGGVSVQYTNWDAGVEATTTVSTITPGSFPPHHTKNIRGAESWASICCICVHILALLLPNLYCKCPLSQSCHFFFKPR